MGDKITIAVMFGGQSQEHEVSRVSAQSVLENIDTEKFDIRMIGISKKGEWLPYNGDIKKISSGEWENAARNEKALLIETAGENPEVSYLNSPSERIAAFNSEESKKVDVVIPVLHGCNGEDGTIQGLFELAGIPYVGCGVLSSAVSMDKAYSKIIFGNEGLPQGKYIVVKRKNMEDDMGYILEQVEKNIGYPCFVKPANAGSSVGVGKVKEPGGLFDALKEAARFDRKILVEQFIEGREVECAVIGNDNPIASTVGEVIPCNEFYDYNAKYIDGDSEIIIPADLDSSIIEEIRSYAVRAFSALECSGLARVDFFVEKGTDKVYINEINTMPGFTSISMYPKLWEASGIPYGELITRLIELAVERHEDNRRTFDR